MPEWISYYAGLIAKGLQTTLSLLAISAVLGFALAVLVALAMTFATMYYLGIGLHKISLGALVLALGLLENGDLFAKTRTVVTRSRQVSKILEAANTPASSSKSQL